MSNTGTSVDTLKQQLTPWALKQLEALGSAVGISIEDLTLEPTMDQERMQIFYKLIDEDTNRTRCLACAVLHKPLIGYEKSDLFLTANAPTDDDVLYYADASMIRDLAVATVRARWSAPEGCEIGVSVETNGSEKTDEHGYRWERSKEAMTGTIGLGMMTLILSDTFLISATRVTDYVHPLLLPDPETLVIGKKGAELINAMSRIRQIKKINARTQRMLEVEPLKEKQ